MKYLFLFGLLFLSKIVFACSCLPLGPIDEKQYNEYDLIFKGKVVKLVQAVETKTIFIKVDSYFKGKQRSKIIKIESPLRSGMCGIFPDVGEQWLVFAYKVGDVFSTSLCTRTRNLTPSFVGTSQHEIEKELRFLEIRWNKRR